MFDVAALTSFVFSDSEGYELVVRGGRPRQQALSCVPTTSARGDDEPCCKNILASIHGTK